MTEQDAMRAAFEQIYHARAWGGESPSGPGSDLARTVLLRDELIALVRRLGVGSVLDAGCGDFQWMRAVDLSGARYVGVDVVPSLVEKSCRDNDNADRTFLVADITRDPLPRADLVLCRDCLVHLPLASVRKALANFQRSGATWLLATTFLRRQNAEIRLGEWQPMNLEVAPFHLPPPVAAIDERCPPSHGDYPDKRLALWRLDSF